MKLIDQYKTKFQQLGVADERILEQMCERFIKFLDTLKEGYLKEVNPEEHAEHDYICMKNPIKYGHPH